MCRIEFTENLTSRMKNSLISIRAQQKKSRMRLTVKRLKTIT